MLASFFQKLWEILGKISVSKNRGLFPAPARRPAKFCQGEVTPPQPSFRYINGELLAWPSINLEFSELLQKSADRRWTA